MKSLSLVILALFAFSSQAIKIRDDTDASPLTPVSESAVEIASDASASETPNYLAEQKLDNGITINVLTQGTGSQCQDGQTATVQYTGALASNGVVFDSSIPRGEPFSFTLGQMRVIKCWE